MRLRYNYQHTEAQIDVYGAVITGSSAEDIAEAIRTQELTSLRPKERHVCKYTFGGDRRIIQNLLSRYIGKPMSLDNGVGLILRIEKKKTI